MKLTIRDRLMIAGLLPASNDFVTMKVVSDLANDLGLSADEIKKYKVRTEVNPVTNVSQTMWDNADYTKEIPFNPVSFGIVRAALKKRDEEKMITVETMSLYERFVLADADVTTETAKRSARKAK